ncbi:hypothetical protein [Kumtagia ephedrae]|uniref:Uncharacterized protein n=1 Tax=Kumtagia ephedrae TaxID=2116701 RepID=A0A2P7S8B1_9HYPH|nr:hypothetical protein [Mesorhizobium ephedrae]PSJ58732.1 hypothetical protein C7I84_14725 [Mesorhizobium ephedrae]
MMDHRDRLILALSALIRAEREARMALEQAIADRTFSPDMLARLAGREAIYVSQEDLEAAEAFVLPDPPTGRRGTA